MSNTDFVQIQRRLLNILDNGPFMDNGQLERAIDGLVGATRRMVRTRQLENGQENPEVTRLVHRVVTPERARTPIGPPPIRTAPQIVEIREVPRPAAELRPAATRVVPSVLMQEMRATLAATTAAVEAPLAWPERWESYPNLNKFRAIGRVKFNSDCKEVCSVCLDTHKNHETVTTDCGHQFCKQCWFSWMSNPTGNQRCPCCRKRRPRTTTFKLMADRKKRQEGPQPMQMF
jgi:hypothetical protein